MNPILSLRLMKSPIEIIQVANLVKNYGDFESVKDISFSVKKGEIFGILGPNGAGKTTTLEILETLRKKTSGKVLINGFDLDHQPHEIQKSIGIQLQSAGFYPKLSLVDTLNMFAAMYNTKIDPMELLSKVNLKDKAKSEVSKLSGGQQQRFSIITTLVNNPTIVFLDEPTTGLDPQARINLWELIREIKNQGTTVVLTTHYMDEAQKLCDRVAIMDSGKIVAIDTPKKLIDNLVKTGFRRDEQIQLADLEDVFLHLTGKTLHN